MYVPDPAPTRITIDFSGSIHPSRAWIIGRVDERGGRVELLAFERRDGDREAGVPVPAPGLSAAQPVVGRPSGAVDESVSPSCTCPEFCELDHANE